MKAKDFRAKAREALRGNWWIAVATTLVATILGVFGTGTAGGTTVVKEYGDKIPQLQEFFSTDAGQVVLVVVGIFAGISMAWALLKLIFGGALSLGYATYTLNLVDSKCAMFADLFSHFNIFLKGFVMQLLRGIYIALWTILLIVPGIIKAYSYAMSPYILAEHPEMGANQAITASKEMMRGNKWRLFCMEISFIGWAFLNIFTLGFGTLWLRPYMETAKAAFYREVSGEKA